MKNGFSGTIIISIFLFYHNVFVIGNNSNNNVFPKKYLDKNPSEMEFTVVNVEPESLEHLPSIGNGHVATVIYSDSVFMNGLFNGKNGNSHRARIPSGNNIRIDFPKDENTLIKVDEHNLTLDVGKAVFLENWKVSIDDGEIRVEQKTFAHRYFTTLIVTQIQVTTTNLKDDFTLKLSSSNFEDDASEDLRIVTIGDYLEAPLKGARFMCAEIEEKENEKEENEEIIIPGACVISSLVPSKFKIFKDITTKTMTFLSGYGSSLEEVQYDFNVVAKMILAGRHDQILQLHVSAWQSIFWRDGGAAIQVEGNIKLAKLVNGCFYYILSSLPFPSVTSKQAEEAEEPFYGLSPSGLPYGSKGRNYQGHSFWDTETWMFPPILYFYPGVAKQILNYRLARVQGARDKARRTGYKGVRFPWESASTGEEASPEDLSEGARSQVHITSDVSFAIRQYIAMARDTDWLKEQQQGYLTNGCGLLREIAEFWISRATYNESTGLYDIRDVMSPDEDHSHGDNNGFTNIGAGYSIFYAKYADCLCGNNASVPDAWVDVAKSLKLIYDKDKDYHPEYEGYQYGTPIKQADVVLMGYPLLYEIPLETRRNDIETFTKVSREDGPAMTWSMHTIAFLELNEAEEAEKMFNRSYQWYMEEPFNIWSEWLPWRVPPSQYTPAVNFITGMGGFLQSIISGYGGMRIYPEKIVFIKPRFLPGSTGLIFRGIKYLGNEIDINISETFIKLIITKRSSNYPLQISENGDDPVIFEKETMVYSTESDKFSLEITTRTETNCDLPYDKIGIVSGKLKNESDLISIDKWWKKLKKSRRRLGTKYGYKYSDVESVYDNKGCSVPFYMKPVKKQ